MLDVRDCQKLPDTEKTVYTCIVLALLEKYLNGFFTVILLLLFPSLKIKLVCESRLNENLLS